MKSKTLKIFFAIGALTILLSSVSLPTFAATTSKDLYNQAAYNRGAAENSEAVVRRDQDWMNLFNDNPDLDTIEGFTRETLKEDLDNVTAGAKKFRAEEKRLTDEADKLFNQETAAQIEDDATALEQQAAALEAQATAMQGVNPAGAQALRDQATALKKQAAILRNQAQGLGGSGRTTTPTDAKTPTKPQTNDPTYKLIVPIPGLDPYTSDPLVYIKGIYNFGIGFGMLIAVAIIVFAGLKWTTSAGNVSAQSEAKDMILNAVFGIVMLLGAILILRTIDPKLATLTIPTLKKVDKSDFDFQGYADAIAKLDKEWQIKQNTYAKLNEELAALRKACADKGDKCTNEDKIKILEKDIEDRKQRISITDTTIAREEAVKNTKAAALEKAKQEGRDGKWRYVFGIFGAALIEGEYQAVLINAEALVLDAYNAVEKEKGLRKTQMDELAKVEKELADLRAAK